MLGDTHMAPKRRNQVALKLTTCAAGCGRAVSYRTNSTVLCETCKPARRAEQKRVVAERIRRAKGVEAVKGTAAKCSDCSGEFTRNDRKAHRCVPCQTKRVAESARARSIARYATKEGRDYAHGYRRRRRETDAAFALNLRIKTYMAKSLQGRKQGRKWQSLVGYNLPDLMVHLERQFLPGMSWDNRALWHIDHIVPLASFTFKTADDPEFRAAWALTNLRPLWKADNLAKSDQRLFLI